MQHVSKKYCTDIPALLCKLFLFFYVFMFFCCVGLSGRAAWLCRKLQLWWRGVWCGQLISWFTSRSIPLNSWVLCIMSFQLRTFKVKGRSCIQLGASSKLHIKVFVCFFFFFHLKIQNMFEERKLFQVELENVAPELQRNYFCGNDGYSKRPF